MRDLSQTETPHRPSCDQCAGLATHRFVWESPMRPAPITWHDCDIHYPQSKATLDHDKNITYSHTKLS